VPDPGKHLPDNPCFFLYNVVARLSSPFVFAHIPIAIRRTGEDIYTTDVGRMAFATATAFQNLGPFIFGDHALYLEEEFIFGTTTHFSIEKYNLDSHPVELIK
jgi:hypothetical protein